MTIFVALSEFTAFQEQETSDTVGSWLIVSLEFFLICGQYQKEALATAGLYFVPTDSGKI